MTALASRSEIADFPFDVSYSSDNALLQRLRREGSMPQTTRVERQRSEWERQRSLRLVLQNVLAKQPGSGLEMQLGDLNTGAAACLSPQQTINEAVWETLQSLQRACGLLESGLYFVGRRCQRTGEVQEGSYAEVSFMDSDLGWTLKTSHMYRAGVVQKRQLLLTQNLETPAWSLAGHTLTEQGVYGVWVPFSNLEDLFERELPSQSKNPNLLRFAQDYHRGGFDFRVLDPFTREPQLFPAFGRPEEFDESAPIQPELNRENLRRLQGLLSDYRGGI